MYQEAHPLGGLYVETGRQIGRNKRIPDLAFVSAARIPPEGEPRTTWPMPPDLAVEYLAAGVKQVWLVSPEHHMVTIYRSATHMTACAGDSDLGSEDLFPGFRCPWREIFTSPVQTTPLPPSQQP